VDPSREGRAAYLRGDLSAAVERFTGAVAAEPRNADALNGLGQSLVRAGRAADALPYFDRAIAIEDDVWAYRFNRARAYGELGEWARAVAEYRAALRLFPDDYVTEFNLARALQADGRINEAVASFERAARLAPGQADFQAALGRALEAARRPREAAAAYRRYLELNPAEPSVDKIRARIGELENRTP
jgi:tetratricopeptide (TPR) repeat protein